MCGSNGTQLNGIALEGVTLEGIEMKATEVVRGGFMLSWFFPGQWSIKEEKERVDDDQSQVQ